MHIIFVLFLLLVGLFAKGGGQLFGMSPSDYALLDSSAKQIVHPRATYTSAMLNLANQHGGPPSTLQKLLEYLPLFHDMARQMGVKPPGTKGNVTPQALNDYITLKAVRWWQNYNRVSGGAGGMFGGMFGDMGSWIGPMIMFDHIF